MPYREIRETDFAAASGPSRHSHIRRDHAGRNYDERRSSNGSQNERSYDDNDGYDNPEDQFAGSAGDRKTVRLPFEDAIGGLFKTITAALDFYDNFKRDFDGETRSVQAYAGPDIIEKLWVRKANSAETRNHGQQKPRDHHDDGLDDRRRPPDRNFRTTYRNLQESFKTASRAGPSSQGRRSSRASINTAANSERLVKKITDAYKEISKLSIDASKNSSDLSHLKTELELVLAYLDKSREMWDRRKANGQSDGQNPCDRDDEGGCGGSDRNDEQGYGGDDWQGEQNGCQKDENRG